MILLPLYVIQNSLHPNLNNYSTELSHRKGKRPHYCTHFTRYFEYIQQLSNKHSKGRNRTVLPFLFCFYVCVYVFAKPKLSKTEKNPVNINSIWVDSAQSTVIPLSTF